MISNNAKREIGLNALRALRDTAILFRNVVVPACHQRNLTEQQFYILSELSNSPRQTATELSDKSGILRTNFASVCRKMELKGLIMRERGEDDKRKVYLDLTDLGEATFAAIVRDVEEALDRGSSVMEDRDYYSIRDGANSLRKLLEAAQD